MNKVYIDESGELGMTSCCSAGANPTGSFNAECSSCHERVESVIAPNCPATGIPCVFYVGDCETNNHCWIKNA